MCSFFVNGKLRGKDSAPVVGQKWAKQQSQQSHTLHVLVLTDFKNKLQANRSGYYKRNPTQFLQSSSGPHSDKRGHRHREGGSSSPSRQQDILTIPGPPPAKLIVQQSLSTRNMECFKSQLCVQPQSHTCTFCLPQSCGRYLL